MATKDVKNIIKKHSHVRTLDLQITMGGGGVHAVLGLRQINTCHNFSLQVNVLDDIILHCLLWVLPFYEYDKSFSAKQHSPLKR